MVALVIICCRSAIIVWFALLLSLSALAGGSGLNVVVVVNQNSTNSVQLGNYYCEKRGVPPQNLLRINWTGNNINWTRSEFENLLRSPLNAMLLNRGLSNQIEYVLLSMDIPYRVTETTGSSATSGQNSTTSALFYGFKSDACNVNVDCPANIPSCSLPAGSASAYAGSEEVFRQSPPISATSNSWLAMMLTATNLDRAKALVDRGLLSDASFPTQRVYLAKSYDAVRSLRQAMFDNVIFDTRLRDHYNVVRTNISNTAGLGPMLGFQSGLLQFSISDQPSIPGAMADNLTSFSGFLFENAGHTTAMDFINNNATASYGTIAEPCAYPEKFPSPQNYFYQARGFSIAECYYQSLANPYQGILVGEPLAAPFAMPAIGNWTGPLPDGAVLAGNTNLSAQFVFDTWKRPLQQVDLFLDGQLLSVLTNLAPQPGNILYVTLTGTTTNYIVPVGATIKSVASGLAARLNSITYSNATKVIAIPHGDRIELQGLNLNTPGTNIAMTVSNFAGASGLLGTCLTTSRSNCLDTVAVGRREFSVAGAVVVGDYLKIIVTRTNGTITSVAVTNQTASSGNIFVDMQIFAQSLLDAINNHPALSGADGVSAEDLVIGQSGVDPAAQFNLYSRTPGWKEAQIQAQLTGSFSLSPAAAGRLEDNLNDLRPRQHLYISSGTSNLSVTFPFNTTTHADGYHELTAVAYEGTHVRTQTRISRNVRIQNNNWQATLVALVGDTNTALEATLQFAVVVSTNNITQIELFTTGGLLAISNNVDSAVFSVPANYLGIGRHPFYAVVTRSDGKQYRTQNLWLRIVGAEPPFAVTALAPLPTLTWPATAGRSYSILSATNATDSFTLRDGIVPTNAVGIWSETNHATQQRFYRVRTP